MLVLARKPSQSIMSGDDIEVSVISTVGGKIRLEIQAPRRISVFRKEAYVKIERDRERFAAAVSRAEVDRTR